MICNSWDQPDATFIITGGLELGMKSKLCHYGPWSPLPPKGAPLTYHEPFPELGRLPDLAENHGVEDDDGDVGDHLDQEELGPEDVVRDVFLRGENIE